MNQPIEIVDRGRGPQLSTSRITVQDVIPYLQRHCTYEQVREIIPTLSAEEFQVIEQYVREHQREVMGFGDILQSWLGLNGFPECPECRTFPNLDPLVSAPTPW